MTARASVHKDIFDRYTLYGWPHSLFTQKLHVALRWYGAPFVALDKVDAIVEELETRSGTHQVPVLHTPEDWMLADTTPILALLDARFPERRLFPLGALGVLAHVAEEVLDEWTSRVMVHYRWHYDENTRAVVSAISGRDCDLETARAYPLALWGRRACRATGTDAPAQRAAAEAEYFEILRALEQQLAATRYALGDRPSVVDAALIGGLRAHTHRDPYPDLSDFPRVLRWCESNEWDGEGAWAPFPESTTFARHLIELAKGPYRAFAIANARALRDGAKAFTAESYGDSVSYLRRPYPEASRQMIVARIEALAPGARREVDGWLDEQSLADCFSCDGVGDA